MQDDDVLRAFIIMSALHESCSFGQFYLELKRSTLIPVAMNTIIPTAIDLSGALFFLVPYKFNSCKPVAR
jgi:hypothetical protein